MTMLSRISGWSPERDNCLSGVIHFGDELVQVGSKIVEGMHEIPRIFYEQSIPGKPVKFLLGIPRLYQAWFR